MAETRTIIPYTPPVKQDPEMYYPQLISLGIGCKGRMYFFCMGRIDPACKGQYIYTNDGYYVCGVCGDREGYPTVERNASFVIVKATE